MKFLSIFLLFLSTTYSCSLCQLQTPLLDVNVELNQSRANFIWIFPKNFSDEVFISFDKNRDKNLDNQELLEIKKSLIDDYLNSRYFVTEVLVNSQNLKFSVINPILNYNGAKFTLNYGIDIDLIKENNITITLHDEDGSFAFDIKKVKSNISDINASIEQNRLFLIFNKSETPIEIDKNITSGDKIEENSSFLKTNLDIVISKIKQNLEQIKNENSTIATIWLLFFSFLYGLIHALGPGHGKSLVATYFLTHNKSQIKALSIASLIGITHTFSALIFTVTIYFIVDVLLSRFLSDVTFYTTKISALIIILIAIYLLYRKFKANKKAKISKWSATPTHSSSCSCSACNTTSSDFGVIISAGIIPCAGTVTIFIFTISMGLYFIGFLSALFMSLGMSLIILISAILSISIRKKLDNKFKNFTKFLEYFSLFFILMLGILLLI